MLQEFVLILDARGMSRCAVEDMFDMAFDFVVARLTDLRSAYMICLIQHGAYVWAGVGVDTFLMYC